MTGGGFGYGEEDDQATGGAATPGGPSPCPGPTRTRSSPRASEARIPTAPIGAQPRAAEIGLSVDAAAGSQATGVAEDAGSARLRLRASRPLGVGTDPDLYPPEAPPLASGVLPR